MHEYARNKWRVVGHQIEKHWAKDESGDQVMTERVRHHLEPAPGEHTPDHPVRPDSTPTIVTTRADTLEDDTVIETVATWEVVELPS